MRTNHELHLIITTRSPMTHGEGSDGNAQVFRKSEALLPDSTSFEYPCISGGAMKATLREHAVWHQADVLGIPDNSVSLDALRLLLKGGKNDKSSTSVPLAAQRQLHDLFPLLKVFGSLDAGHGIRGQISVSDLIPITQETLEAGLIPEKIQPTTLALKGEEVVQGESFPLIAGEAPALHNIVGTQRQYFRHDLGVSSAAQLMSHEDQAERDERKQLASDAKAAKASGKGVDTKALAKDARRAANESMPHAYQTVQPGVRFYCSIRLDNADELSFGVLISAIRRWIETGAQIGGGRGKGHGFTSVQLAGHVSYNLPTGVAPMLGDGAIVKYQLENTPKSKPVTAYEEHLLSRKEAILKASGVQG